MFTLHQGREPRTFLVRLTEENNNYDALFSGPGAEERGENYAHWMNVQLTPVETTVEESLAVVVGGPVEEVKAEVAKNLILEAKKLLEPKTYDFIDSDKDNTEDSKT